MSGRVVIGGGKSVGVHEVRGRHSQPLRVGIHHLREGGFGSADLLRECDRCIVPRLHDHAFDQYLRRDLRADLHEAPRPFRLPGVLADGDLVGQLQPAFLQSREHDVGAHQLGEARRLHAIVGMVLGQDPAAEVIHQDVGAGADRRRGRDRRSTLGCAGRDQSDGEDGKRGVRHKSAGRGPRHPRQSPQVSEERNSSAKRSVVP